jgi:lipid A 3-O-deacylase
VLVRSAWLVWFAAALVPRPSAAQDTLRVRTALFLRVDNDLIALRGGGPPADYDYTHGTLIGVVVPNGPARLAQALGATATCDDPAASRRCIFSAIGIGQEIYTPRHNVGVPLPGDRPYAAWLYGVATAMRVAPSRLDSLSVRAGVTGPPALGEQLQNGVHRLLHNHLEEGWSHQLPARLAAAVSYDVERPIWVDRRSVTSRLSTIDVGGTLGNLRRELHAAADVQWTFGARVAPSAERPLATHPGRWSLGAGYREAYVVHDAFIQGASGVRGAVLTPWVGEAYASLGAELPRHWFVSYRYVVRGREYRAEGGTHAYGSVALARTR